MKIKSFISLTVAAISFCACSQRNNVTIQGKINNCDSKSIVLEKLNVAGREKIDSVKINADGTFKIKSHVSMPTFYLLRLNENKFITLLVDSAESVNIQADYASFTKDYAIQGSEGSQLVNELTRRLAVTNHKLDSIHSLSYIYQANDNYKEKMQEWNKEVLDIKQKQTNYSSDFVTKHPFSLASVMAIYQKFNDDIFVLNDVNSMKIAASALQAMYPESDHAKALYEDTKKQMKIIQQAKLSRMYDQLAVNSPDIELPNQHGKNVKLSSYRGKYVLLQFWSANDLNSRIQNEILLKNYKLFKSKGFDIYQVSIDESEKAWKEAITKDKLPWTQVADLKGSHQAIINYNVQKIPSNYLLDTEGKILAKDLKGPQLNKVLSDIFN